MLDEALLGALIAFCVATACTPVGVSGAVFLVPVQVSVLDTPSPAVTPTNLLYNLIAIPGALARLHRQGRLGGPLVRLLVVGTLPGVVAGAVIRVEWLAGLEAFTWSSPASWSPSARGLPSGALRQGTRAPRTRSIIVLALAVGTIGGIYGIGGGSILGPSSWGSALPWWRLPPPPLAATFLTSIAGVASCALLSLTASGNVAPDWIVGIGLGLGGLAGGVVGVAVQDRLSEIWLRRGLGVLAVVLGARYAVLGLT